MDLIIDSRDRITGSPSKFRIQLDKPISGRYILSHTQIPHVVPVVTESNNTLTVTIAGTSSVIALSNPLYCVSEILVSLETQLNAVSNVFSVTQNVYNKRIQISRTGTALVQFLPLNSTVASIIGLLNEKSISGGSGSSITFDGPLNLASPLSYRIAINSLFNFEDSAMKYCTFYIPVNVNSFEIASYKSKEHATQVVIFDKPTKTLDITLIDVMSDWQIVLKKCLCSK
jgi:hypothetical protein